MVERKHPLAKCEECPLYPYQWAPTHGPTDATVAVVSRSPGRHDTQAKRPFAGPAGRVLDHLLSENGVNRSDVLTTNVVLCTSDKPPQEAINACKPRLLAEIENAETVLACGAEATKLLLGRSVHGSRGFTHEVNGYRVVATFNPAAALHDDSTFPDLIKDFKLALNPPQAPTLPEVSWTDDIPTATVWAKRILESNPTRLFVDLETTSLSPRRGRIVAAGFSLDGTRSLCFGERVCTDKHFRILYLKRLFELEETRYCWHNGKFDIKHLLILGINARVDDDTMLLSYALDERPGVHSLEYLLMDELGWPDYEPESVKEFKKTGVLVEPAELYKYNALDCAGTAQLFPILRRRASSDSVLYLYEHLLAPSSQVWARAELKGMKYDDQAAADLWETEIMPQLAEWREQLRSIVGDGGYNPNSPKQTAEYMYDFCLLRHKLWRKTEREGNTRSTDKWVRAEIIEGRFDCLKERKDDLVRFAETLEEYKSLDKQRSNYIEGLIVKRDEDGRIHTDFKLHGTESGRYSSKGPNLQNITRPKAGLPNIRNLFVADNGNILLQADYSQAELRCFACIAPEPNLAKIYRQGLDLHSETARAFYGDNYTKEQRVYAKNINFGIGYDQGAKSFAQMYKMPLKEAQAYIDWWKERFPAIEEFRKRVHADVLSTGIVSNPIGRKRRFHLITDENKDHSLKEAVNFVIQSAAHELTMWSAIRLHERIDYSRAAILLDVHDSLLFECEVGYLAQLEKLVKEVMESAAKELFGWDLPFTVDTAIGERWGSLTEIS